MGVSCSRICSSQTQEEKTPTIISPAVPNDDLLTIKNHPDRTRRRSSAIPINPAILEDKVLEVLCDTTDIEPDVGADEMGKKQLQKLVRKISQSSKFTSQFQSEEDFEQHFQKPNAANENISSLHTSSKPSRKRFVAKYIDEL